GLRGMRELQIRIPKTLSSRLLQEIRKYDQRESVVFALASHATTLDHDLILIKDVIIPPPTAFLPSNGHGARWTGAYMIELLNVALERCLGLFIFHAHGNRGQVRLSEDDLNSANQLLPQFQLAAPNRPHGSIVIGPDSAA